MQNPAPDPATAATEVSEATEVAPDTEAAADTEDAVDALRAWLTERLAEHVGVPAEDIDPDLAMSGYGLSSLYALTLADEIEDHLGIALDSTIMWDNPTVTTLLAALERELVRPSS
ncbi:acyl carrier protein [Kitasatospora purpeofusca]|uniref:Acyl carrier protein n=1 Tax=Kitasatospora purpeofusca TaxID=67352 RepID=A0ABZ1TTE6_9ACTN|nr:acyl carrier protein [Kitasatospora purpeofusca]